MALKRMLMATDLQGAPVAIGPVFTDETVDRLRDEIEEAGWANLGTAAVSSVTAFRAEAKQARSEW